jgi:tetratricopeptide (TPR) repeat protein
MPTPPQFHVFLSAVSREFSTERVQLEKWLERKGLHVSSQEKFNQGDSTLWQKLYDEVARCQAVICVIGAEPGWSSGGELPQGAPERSWTQWEFWLAWGQEPWSPPRRDKVYVFFPSDLDERLKKARDAAAGAVDRLHALDLQQAHIERIKDTSKHYETFTDLDDLIKKCLVLKLPDIERTKPNNLPYGSLGSLFKGRDKTLEEIHRQLSTGTNRAAIPARQVIHGQGGVGKTRLAIEYAQRYADAYQALLFLISEKPESLRQNLAAFCGPLALNLPEQDAQEEEIRVNAALRWLHTHQEWLLIIDNIDTPEVAARVEELIGTLRGGTILITSRLTDWSPGIVTCELDVVSVEIATAFLLERTKDRRRLLPGDEINARELAQELGGLALALEQAGAYIAKERPSIDEYLKRWRERDKVVREWFDERLTKYPRSVMTTWKTTTQQLSTSGSALLDSLSWLGSDPIPRTLLDTAEWQNALAELAGFSLVKIEEGGSRFQIHRLLQDVTREQQDEDDKALSFLCALMMLRAAAVGSPQDVHTWPIWEPLRPHIAAVTAYADQYGDAKIHTYLISGLAVLAVEKAEYSEAEPLLRRALSMNERTYGPDHSEVALPLNNLAQLLGRTNRLDEAEPLMRRALTIDEASYGLGHPNVARDLNNLGALLIRKNRLDEAEPLIRRALAIDEASYGPEHPLVAINLNNLATLLQDTNQLGEAESLMRRALSIDEVSYGPDHPRVAIDLNNLAQLLQATNRYKEAEPLMQRALAIDEADYGPNHPNVARDLNNLGNLLEGTNRRKEAEPLMRRALAIDEASYSTNHPDVARDLNNLGQLLQDTNRQMEAEPLIRRVLAIDETSYGSNHPLVARDLGNLARLLHATNRSREAEPLMRRALAIHEASSGPEHRNVITPLNNLAQLLQATKRLKEAEALMRRALAIAEASYERDSPEMATPLNNLAQLLKTTKRLKEAESLMQRALRALLIFADRQGHEHPNLRSALVNYLEVMQALGLDPERALDKIETEVGVDPGKVVEILSGQSQIKDETKTTVGELILGYMGVIIFIIGFTFGIYLLGLMFK